VVRRITPGEAFDVRSVHIDIARDPAKAMRVHMTQAFGLIKYCSLSYSEAEQQLSEAVTFDLYRSGFTPRELIDFDKTNHPVWLPEILS